MCCYCYVSECRWPCPGQRRAWWKTRYHPVSCSRVQVNLKHVQGHELTLWSLPSDANVSSACQGIPRILWNPKVHYHIHNSPSHVPEPDQCSPFHRPISWRYISILSSPLRLGLPIALFPSSFPTKTLNATRSLYFWQIFCWLVKGLPPRSKWVSWTIRNLRFVVIFTRRFGTTHQSHLQGLSSLFNLKKGPIGCLETSVTNYLSKLRKVPEERSSQMLCQTDTRSLRVGRIRTEAASEVWEDVGYRT